MDFFVYNYEVAQNCASPFINESSNRDVYIIGLEVRRTGKHLLDKYMSLVLSGLDKIIRHSIKRRSLNGLRTLKRTVARP